MFKQLHPVFQIVLILAAFFGFIYTSIHFHVAFVAAVLLGIEAAVLGASATTHEENVLGYNLEDKEIDTLANLEGRLIGDEKKLVGKIKSLAQIAKL